jgi:serine/threonine-protein kinase
MVRSRFQAIAPAENTLFAAAASSLLLQSQLSVIEKNLTHYLGPVAKMLVKKQAKNASNIDQLIGTLMAQIPSDQERKKFITSLDFSTYTYSNESLGNHSLLSTSNKPLDTLFSTDYIEQLTTNLSQYLGPVAKHLIKATLKKVSNKEQLCSCLADKIPNLKERADFLKKCR